MMKTREVVSATLLGAAFVMAAALSSCSDSGGGTSCPPGSKNCPCKAGDSCDDGLECKDGYCVPTSCPQGNEGCPCFPNNTCNNGLECSNGICQEPGCPAGKEGCACLNGTTCEEGLECKDGKCVKKDCQPGTEGCPCDNGSCNEGLDCKDGVCVAKSGSHGLSIGNAEARACDVLFDAGTSGAASAAFDSSVIGRFRLKGDKLAVSFTSKTDSPLQGKVLRLLDETGSDVDAAKISGMDVTCYDRKGAALSDAEARLE